MLEAQAASDEPDYVHQGEQVVDAGEALRRTGSPLVLCCVHPQHVPNALDQYGSEFLREQWDAPKRLTSRANWGMLGWEG